MTESPSLAVPQSASPSIMSIRASPLPLVPEHAGRTLDFVHRSRMRKGSWSLFYFTVWELKDIGGRGW